MLHPFKTTLGRKRGPELSLKAAPTLNPSACCNLRADFFTLLPGSPTLLLRGVGRQLEVGDDQSVITLRILLIGSEGDVLVMQQLVVDLRAPVELEEAPGNQHVINHLSLPKVQVGVARRLGDALLARH